MSCHKENFGMQLQHHYHHHHHRNEPVLTAPSSVSPSSISSSSPCVYDDLPYDDTNYWSSSRLLSGDSTGLRMMLITTAPEPPPDCKDEEQELEEEDKLWPWQSVMDLLFPDVPADAAVVPVSSSLSSLSSLYSSCPAADDNVDVGQPLAMARQLQIQLMLLCRLPLTIQHHSRDNKPDDDDIDDIDDDDNDDNNDNNNNIDGDDDMDINSLLLSFGLLTVDDDDDVHHDDDFCFPRV
jgi:hypothetical protein